MEQGSTGPPLATLDVVIAGLADRINNTLAAVLLHVEMLDEIVVELAGAAGLPPDRAGTMIDEVVGAVARIRDVVKDLQVLTGDEHADAAETFGAILRLVRPDLGDTELVDRVQGPARTRVPRRRLATAGALAVREVQRAVDGCRGTVTASLASAGGEIAIDVRAALEPGRAHRLDARLRAWDDVRAMLAADGGRLRIEPAERGVAIELRLPASAG